MASPSKRRPENVSGDFFVDTTCIDCDVCRWMAPAVFEESGGQSRVHHQPETEDEKRFAVMALLSCPTGSIGGGKGTGIETRELFPTPVDANVYHCGYHHVDSYAATSYFIQRPEGNILVDSPRFVSALVKQMENMGGVKTLFLTHRDDVGDHEKFAAHFGCERILHKLDQSHSTKDVERVLEGDEPAGLGEDLLAIPVPGHTKGSVCLLYQNKYLFTGDHLAWSDDRGHLYAFRDACWYSWKRLKASMQHLAGYEFEWVLPGHGRRCHFEPARMKQEMARCLSWLQSLD